MVKNVATNTHITLMDEKRIVSFGLLAHINDNESGIKDFNDIFIPIVKATLSKLNQKGVKSGESIGEIKKAVDSQYALDIPYPFLKKVLRSIAEDVSINSQNEFLLHKDDSFQMNRFIFADYEEEFEQNVIDVQYVIEAYEEFLKTNSIDPSTQPSIFKFIDQHRLQLSNFFAYTAAPVDENVFIYQANFIRTIKGDNRIYNILRRIYLGSIIAAYLEVQIGKVKNPIELVLDTNFILGLLDLNSVESHHTCTKILKICAGLGYSATVLPVTIEETQALLRRKSEDIDKSFFQSYLDTESILSAVHRRKLSKTQLHRISAQLSRTLEEQFDIYLLPNDEKFQNLAKYNSSGIYDFYIEARGNKLGALHDTTTTMYVRTKRGNKRLKGDFSKACCWFVTNTPRSVYYPNAKGYLPEIIRAGDLLNALWLSNPNVTSHINGHEIAEIGITRTVSNTISNSLPTPRVLRELDDNFVKFNESNDITADDTVVIANMILSKQISTPETLNTLASNNAEEFIDKVKELVAKGRKQETAVKDAVEQLIARLDKMKLPIEAIHSPMETVTVNDPEHIEKIARQLKQIRGQRLVIIGLIGLMGSVLWWFFDQLFNITTLSTHQNYWIIKIAGQLVLIFFALALALKKNWSFWIGAAISAVLAILLYFKK